MIIIFILLFVLGISVGSFLNVLIDRLPNGENPLKGRSYCDHCKKTLKWYDMAPVFSYIFLRGKCRHCHSPISKFYPIVELTTGILFVITAYYLSFTIYPALPAGGHLPFNPNNFQFSIFNFQFAAIYIYYLFIACSLIVIFFSDLKYGIIPDAIILPAIIISFFFLFFTSKESWFSFPLQPATFEVFAKVFANKFLSGLAAFAFFLLLYLITRGRGMGLGDVKFAFLMGLILGFPRIIPAFYIAFLTGAIIGIILIIWGKKKLSTGKIPFGPFLVLGTFIGLFLGDRLIQLLEKILPGLL